MNISGVPCHGSASKLQLVLCCVASPSTNVAVRTKVAIFTSFLLQHLSPGILVVKAISWPSLGIYWGNIGKCHEMPILSCLFGFYPHVVYRDSQKNIYFIQNPRCFKQCWFTIFTFYHILSSCLVAGTPPPIPFRFFRARGRIYMQGRSLNGSSEWYPIFNNPQVGVCGFTMVCYGFLMFFVGWSSPNPGKTIENGFSWIKYDQRRSNPSNKRVKKNSFAKQQLLFVGTSIFMGHGFHGFHSELWVYQRLFVDVTGNQNWWKCCFPCRELSITWQRIWKFRTWGHENHEDSVAFGLQTQFSTYPKFPRWIFTE